MSENNGNIKVGEFRGRVLATLEHLKQTQNKQSENIEKIHEVQNLFLSEFKEHVASDTETFKHHAEGLGQVRRWVKALFYGSLTAATTIIGWLITLLK